MMKNKIKNILKDEQKVGLLAEHRGEVGFETMIVMPFAASMYFLLITLFFFGITYVSYNNFANNIAAKMDMRADGFRDKSTQFSYSNTAAIGKAYFTDAIKGTKEEYSINIGTWTGDGNVKTEDKVMNPALNSAIYSLVKKGGNSSEYVNLPGAKITRIDAYNDKAISMTNSNSNVGTVIKVEITYEPETIFPGVVNKQLSMKADGYALIH